MSTNTLVNLASAGVTSSGQTSTSSGGASNLNSSFPSSTTGSGGSGIGSSGSNYYNHYAPSTNPNDVADFRVCFFLNTYNYFLNFLRVGLVFIGL